MPNQARYFLLFLFAFVMLVLVLMQSACNKEDEEREDFIYRTRGEWVISQFGRVNLPNSSCEISIVYFNDSVRYDDFTPDVTIYSLYDPILCTLPFIQNMGTWTFNENNDDLLLEIQDYCGKTINYKIEINSLYFTNDLLKPITCMHAKIKLVNPDTVITIEDFNVVGVDFDFVLKDGGYSNNFSGHHL